MQFRSSRHSVSTIFLHRFRKHGDSGELFRSQGASSAVFSVLLFEVSKVSSQPSFLGETSRHLRFGFFYPKQSRPWVTQQLPDQDQACHLRVDRSCWSCWSRWSHTRTWRTYDLLPALHSTSLLESVRKIHLRWKLVGRIVVAGLGGGGQSRLASHLYLSNLTLKYLKIMTSRDNKTTEFRTSLAAAVLPTAGAGLKCQQKFHPTFSGQRFHIKNRKPENRQKFQFSMVFWWFCCRIYIISTNLQNWLDGFGHFLDPNFEAPPLWPWIKFSADFSGWGGFGIPQPSPELPPNDLRNFCRKTQKSMRKSYRNEAKENGLRKWDFLRKWRVPYLSMQD